LLKQRKTKWREIALAPFSLYILHPNSTTSFLTAANLVYAIGAGITAAAGTRLALQLFLVQEGF